MQTRNSAYRSRDSSMISGCEGSARFVSMQYIDVDIMIQTDQLGELDL